MAKAKADKTPSTEPTTSNANTEPTGDAMQAGDTGGEAGAWQGGQDPLASSGDGGFGDPIADAGQYQGNTEGDGTALLAAGEEWAPLPENWSTGQAGDLLADFDASDLIASTDIRAYFVKGGKYPGMLEVAGMKYQEMPLAKKHGIMLPVQCLFIEYVVTIDITGMTTPQGTPLPSEVDPKVEGLFIMPIRVKPGYAIATPEEHEKFQEFLSRGQEQIGPFYNFAEMPLMPDPNANNRLAPLGSYAVPKGAVDAQGRKRRPGLHENWQSLLDYRMLPAGPAGFPVTIKPDNGYLNPTVIDRSTFAGMVQRTAENARQTALAAEGFKAQGYSETPVTGEGFPG